MTGRTYDPRQAFIELPGMKPIRVSSLMPPMSLSCRTLTARTALPLLGPWAPPLPSGGWVLYLPGGRTRFTWSDDPGPPGARRVTFGEGLAAARST